jgi:septum formation protein
MKLILASSSPRRVEVLRDAGITFEVVTTNVDETRLEAEPAEKMVRRLAEAKARAAAIQVVGPAIVIGADTVVVLGEDVLGKPASAEDARAMLARLSGKTHAVMTGVAVLRLPERTLRIETESTRVTMAPYTAQEIADYVAGGEPMDKAGAYAIQGRGGRFVTSIEGCYFNVVGLPLARLYRILKELGWGA